MRCGVGTPCKCAAACRGVLTRSTVEHLVPKDLSLVLSFFFFFFFAPWSQVGCILVSIVQHRPPTPQRSCRSTASHSGLRQGPVYHQGISHGIPLLEQVGFSVPPAQFPSSATGPSALPASPGADFRITLVHLTGFRGPALAPPESWHSWPHPPLRDCDQLVIARSPEDGDLCPVRVLERFLVAGKHAPADPILRRVTTCRRKQDYLRGAMSYRRARELVSQTLSRVGISPEGFGTHSLRAGGATAAARAHVPDRLIQRHGGWLCPGSKDKYINDSLNDALSVSRAVLRS